MKKTACLLCALLLLVLTACQSGGGAPQESSDVPSLAPTARPSEEVETPSPTPTEEPTPAAEFTNPLTGEATQTDLSGRRPAAVMLNNLRAAMPQQGNSAADIIYEALAEGGITRMLGLYQDPGSVGLIGSVRSARLYYLELAMGHDAVYIHAGGSPEFYTTKNNQGLFTVDGVNGYYSSASAGMFWRDRERVAGHYYGYEHSLLTSGEAITAMMSQREVEEHESGYTYEMSFAQDGTPADGTPAAIVTVPFSGGKSTIFRYDEESGRYLVEEYGEPYLDGNDGAQVSVTNLLVVQTTCTVMDDYGRISVDLSSGGGWFACGGRIVPITWEKGSMGSQLRYYTEDGQPLTLGVGKSYVCIIPTSQVIVTQESDGQ